jgi:orotate phosphoribosyltransferase
MSIDTQTIARALLSIDAVKFTPHEPKTFKSGIIAPVYIDNRAIPYHPPVWQQVIAGFAERAQTLDYDLIAGIAVAGVPHSAALAYHLSKPSVFVRKEAKGHGLKNRIEGGLVQGKAVLLIEDLVTTGGSSLDGVNALREAEAIVNDALAIVSYGFPQAKEAFKEAGVNLHTLTDFDAIVQVSTLSAADAATIQKWRSDPYGWRP